MSEDIFRSTKRGICEKKRISQRKIKRIFCGECSYQIAQLHVIQFIHHRVHDCISIDRYKIVGIQIETRRIRLCENKKTSFERSLFGDFMRTGETWDDHDEKSFNRYQVLGEFEVPNSLIFVSRDRGRC
jgi:hypothetical protein